jgi:hypothetical protein
MRPLHHGSLASRAPVVPLPRYRGGGKNAFSSSRRYHARASLLSDPPCQTATHSHVIHRKPGHDDAELHSRDATSIRVFFHASRKLASNGREAMSLLPKMSLLPQRGRRSAEWRTNGCRASMRRRGRGPINKRTARLSALLRGHAPGFLPTRPGPRFLESPDANGRTLSGTSAASTSQSGTRRTGRCPSRLQAKSDELRPQEPHPLRQSASPVDVPYDERDGRR